MFYKVTFRFGAGALVTYFFGDFYDVQEAAARAAQIGLAYVEFDIEEVEEIDAAKVNNSWEVFGL